MSLAGCSKNTPNASASNVPKQLKIAAVLKTVSVPYWQTIAAGTTDAGKELGISVDVFAPPAEENVEEQINMLENAIQSNYDGLVFAPCQAVTAISLLEKAKEANIPVVLVDTPMPDGFNDFVTYIGSDNYQIGVLAAQELITLVPNKNAKILIIEGIPGNPTTSIRADAATKTFTDAGYKIFDRQPANSDREKAFTVMQNALQREENIDIVFTSNDDMAEGASMALAQAGKKAIVTGVDGSRSTLEYIRDGGVYGTLAQDGHQMGYLGVKSVVDAINGKEVPKKIDVPTPFITKDNVSEYLK
jgi:ribose transport system substrate-binding protein